MRKSNGGRAIVRVVKIILCVFSILIWTQPLPSQQPARNQRIVIAASTVLLGGM